MEIMRLSPWGKGEGIFTAAGSVTSCRAPGRGRPGARGWGRCRVCGSRHRPHRRGGDRRVRLSRSAPPGGTVSICGQAQPSHGVRGWPACAAHACRPHVWAHRGQRPQVVAGARPHVVPRFLLMVILMFLLQMCRGRVGRGRGNACVVLTRRRAGSAPGGHRRLASSRRPRPRRKGRDRETRCRAGLRGGSRQRRRRGQ
jgi:hypothetical protein